MDLQIGSTIGDYRVEGVLGAGGMGSVYRVRNLISDRVEALKVALPDLAGDPDLAERFQREIKVQATLEHPNIAQLRTAFRDGNRLLMVMELVDGVTLEQKLKDGPMAVPQAIDAIRQVLSALEFAHEHGIVHRDIKPSNMILTPTGIVKLMDFGIAKAAGDHALTSTGTAVGSLYYMAPEQIQGLPTLDGRADLYSVGVTLYQLVTGQRPFDGDSQYAIMAAHLEKTPVPPISLDPNLPRPLNDVILMSVTKDPNGRFQSAGAFRNALAAVAATVALTQPLTAAPTVLSPTPFATAAQPIAPAAPPHPAPLATAAAPGVPVMPPHPASPHAAPAGPVPRPTAAPKGKRVLWMALGGIAVAAAVVCAIEFGPWKGAKANSAQPAVQVAAPVQSAPAAPQPDAVPQPQTQPETPAAASMPAPAPNPAASPTPNAATSRPAPRPAVTPTPYTPPQPVQPPQQQQAQQAPPPYRPEPEPAAPRGPSREALARANEHSAKLHVRAGAIRSSLRSLQRSQQSQGLNLSARFTQPEGLMDTYLQAAAEALNQGDLPAFREYSDKAERQIEILEKLLNL